MSKNLRHPELSEKNPYWIERHRYYELKTVIVRNN